MAGVDVLATAMTGANAAYLADLYARWAEKPDSVDPSMAELFAALNDEARAVLTDATGASWAPRIRGAFGPDPEAPRAPRRRHPRQCRGRAPPGARQPARADADPLLPRARAPGSAARPARPDRAQGASGARPAHLRLHRRRHGPADLPRHGAGEGDRDAARDHGDLPRVVLRADRRRVHAHPGSRPEILDPAPDRGRALADRLRRRRPRPNCWRT